MNMRDNIRLMSMIFLSAILISTGNSCGQKVNDYVPKYHGDWETVRLRILQTWSQSKVDSTTLKMPGSLELPMPYFSIHKGRNVLFGWDTYFTNLGLLQVDSFAVYAKNAVENQFAEIDQLGYVPNASEPWAQNRAQTPFLSMMVRDVYENLQLDKKWLFSAYEYLRKDYEFWTDTSAESIENHNTDIEGLQRFSHHATEEELLNFYEQIAPRFGFQDSLQTNKKLLLASSWMAEAESGMDFNPRFDNRCNKFIPVDLNANLFLYEKNFQWMVIELGLENEPDWEKLASKRKKLLTKYCWNEEKGLFYDYDFVNDQQSSVASIANFYVLWAGMASEKQAEKIVGNLPLFEYESGPTICEKTTQHHVYQWDYPAGWPPIYYLVAQGLHKYGYDKEAQRIAAKYLDVVTKNFQEPIPISYQATKRGTTTEETREPGFVYEKYNVVKGTINDAEYPSRAFQGWSYGVFIWAFEFYQDSLVNAKL